MQPLTGNVEQIRGWMTIPHVARLYRVPEEVLFEALGLPAGETYRNRSLNQINREFFAGQPMVVLRIVRTTILEYYAAHPEIQPPPGMPPAPTLVAPPGNVPAPTPLEAPKPSTRDLRHRYWPGQRWSPIDFSQ